MKKIKTALLSYGMSGKVFHSPFLDLHEGYQLLGAWERSRKKIQKDYPNTKSYSTIEDLLSDDIDLVIVNTPVDSHFEYAQKALLANKNVIVEKAFTTNSDEAVQLKNLATEKNLKLTVFQNRRWDSDFLTVKSILDSRVLGDIVEAEIRFDRYNPILSPKVWKESDNEGAGVLMDLGSHIIDQSVCLFGFPKAVFADIRKIREKTIIHDNIDILLYYLDKRVRLHAGFFNKEQLPGFVLQGRKGSFLKERADVQEDTLKLGTKPNADSWCLEPKEKEGLLHITKEGEEIYKKTPTLNGNYYDFFELQYQSIANNKPEPVNADDGIKVMKIIEAAKKSSLSKTVVEI